MTNVIDSFRGEYYFLSNFYPAKLELHFDKNTSFLFPTSEHAFQAYKAFYSSLTYDEAILFIKEIVSNEDPGSSKKAGRKINLDTKRWAQNSYRIMKFITKEKFIQNNDLKEKLLNTKDLILIEGNNWGDTLWGVCNGVGKNQLGEILMAIREEMKII